MNYLCTDPKWLLVEDNQINMEIANMILAQMGFDVDIAVQTGRCRKC